MSLRAFHLLFIVMSVLLTVFFAVWAAGQYQAAPSAGFALTGVVSLACGAALAAYGAAFRRKTRRF